MKKYNYGIKCEPPAIAEKAPEQYPWLNEDKHCDVCVIGGGLTGAMCALTAADMGLSVVLITSEGIGYGDTGHITGCARFDGGRTLVELDRLMTIDEALKLYSMGFNALDGLQNLCGRLDGEYNKTGVSSGFRRNDLFIFTSASTDVELMEREYISVKNTFSQCALITRRTAESSFEFTVSCGILTKEGSAVLNPYALAHMCLMKAEKLGTEIFEQTEAIDIQTPRTDDGCVIITTSTHRNVYADKLIFAAGSKGFRIMPGRIKNYKLFAVIGLMPANGTGWSGRCTLGTFGRHPKNCSIYPGNCLAASCVYRSGGLQGLIKRSDETAGSSELSDFIRNVLPEPAAAKMKYEYSYDFPSSMDGLPIIGKHDAYKNCIFALPGLYRDSGVPIFSHISAEIAKKILQDSSYENHPLFDPMRL